MSYKLTFLKPALKEWSKLSNPIKEQFKKKLEKCLENPHIKSSVLSGVKDCYKIKLRATGYRLVYKVFDSRLIVQVVVVGKRDKGEVYNKMKHR
ncbi:type II toxin-antitoxin system RelE family toxin [Candidatus Bandiella numerosa]|uniref:type II toxin-antitoxin system RelE family toxin n=1 Tax=Candidatus Bandiella numerosa TaxID=2570586 RepID=UPI001F468685|nr:type II toxin-antitoxin system RelE/ParE family toxin [Candidatus Bandiella numerosa]